MKVLVTGANGHLGNHIVRELSRQGISVVAGVRDIHDKKKTQHLEAIPVEIRQADILSALSLKQAMDGITHVIHCAAPVILWSENPQKDIFDPIVRGTKNVLEVANAVGVQKVVMTSSCSSMGWNGSIEKPISEDQWNTGARLDLIRAKMLAEQDAWKFSKEKKMNFVTICCPSIVGPGFYQSNPNTKLYEDAFWGKLFGLPFMGFHLVDVRDAALGHVLALDSKAWGRYIVAGEYLETSQLLKLIKAELPSKLVIFWPIPKTILYVLAIVDYLNWRVLGRSRVLPFSVIREFVGNRQRVDSSRIRHELGWKSRPYRETLRDTFAWIRERSLVKIDQ